MLTFSKKKDPRLGSLLDKKDIRDYKFSLVIPETPPLPPIVDWEASMTAVKDQGSRGACVAFGMAAMKEWQEKKQRKGKDFNLSEAFIYEQVRQPGGGSFPRDALKVMKDMGVSQDRLLPYNPTISDDAPKSFTPALYRRAIGNAKFYRIEGFSRLGTHQDIMQAIAFSGPVVVGMVWLSDWFKTGEETSHQEYPILVWNPDGDVAGRHMFVLCGYDLSDPKRPLYKIRNSWGTNWGRGGYAYIEQSAIFKGSADVWATYDMQNPLVSHEGVRKEKKRSKKVITSPK